MKGREPMTTSNKGKIKEEVVMDQEVAALVQARVGKVNRRWNPFPFVSSVCSSPFQHLGFYFILCYSY
jgi:hypothetical protein